MFEFERTETVMSDESKKDQRRVSDEALGSAQACEANPLNEGDALDSRVSTERAEKNSKGAQEDVAEGASDARSALENGRRHVSNFERRSDNRGRSAERGDDNAFGENGAESSKSGVNNGISRERSGGHRGARPNRQRQESGTGGNGRNSPFRTPASLMTMPRQVETGLANQRNAKTTFRSTSAPESKKRADGRVVRQPFNGEAHLYEVIQVRLSRSQRLVEVNTNGVRLSANTTVLIRFHRNILMATTVGCRYRRVAEINALPFVVRVATEDDMRIDAENAEFEKHAHELALEFAISQNLQMKVLSTDLSHDHKNVTVNFASDVRVDFREMVAYLASKLKMRVEMFQLGLRNGTGLICGLGSCGQLLCCGRFLGQFDPIAVRQLRAQGMASNPKRISGVCGRLYCCMSYEYCDYTREKRNLPKKGKRVLTRWGIGRITDIDMLREDIVVTYDNGEVQRMTARDCVGVTDEIQGLVDSGKIEFPIEPVRFYLNADPAGAYEPSHPLRAGMLSKAPHLASNSTKGNKKAGGTKTSNPVGGAVKGSPAKASSPSVAVARSPQTQKNASKSANRASQAPSRTGNAPKGANSGVPSVRGPKLLRGNGADKRDPVGIVPEVSSAPPSSELLVPTPGAPRQLSHGAPVGNLKNAPRAPRKVKARQSNLSDLSNDVKRDAPRSSRRQVPTPGKVPPEKTPPKPE